jgi:hypothetical protein
VICVYCGRDAGEYDEHEECVERSLSEAVADELKGQAEAADYPADINSREDT